MDELFREDLRKEYKQSHKAKYIDDLIKIITDSEPDFLVTLTFAYPDINEWIARAKLKTWLKWVNQYIYGRRSKERLVVFSFREYRGSYGLHYHLIIKDPNIQNKKDIADIFKRKWLKISGTGHSSFRDRDLITDEFKWFKKVWNYENLTEYLNKEAREQKMDNLEVECTNY